eukprot:3250951-Pyramimonas_sp.AAC.1
MPARYTVSRGGGCDWFTAEDIPHDCSDCGYANPTSPVRLAERLKTATEFKYTLAPSLACRTLRHVDGSP